MGVHYLQIFLFFFFVTFLAIVARHVRHLRLVVEPSEIAGSKTATKAYLSTRLNLLLYLRPFCFVLCFCRFSMNNLDRPLGDIIKANKKAKKPAPKKNTKKAAPAKKSSKKQTQQPSGAVRNQRPRARTAPYTPKQTLGGGLTAGAKVMVTNLVSLSAHRLFL